MPANLTPDYLAAEARFRAAQTDDERFAALKEMLAKIPKHKGTDRLQGDIRRRMAKLKDKMGSRSDRGSADAGAKYADAQVAFIGRATQSASELILSLAPFVSARMADLSGVEQQTATSGIRGVGMVVIVLDVSDDALLDHLESARIEYAEFGVELAGRGSLAGDCDLGSADTKYTVIAAVGMDDAGSDENYRVLTDCYGDEFDIFPLSASDYGETKRLAEHIAGALNL